MVVLFSVQSILKQQPAVLETDELWSLATALVVT